MTQQPVYAPQYPQAPAPQHPQQPVPQPAMQPYPGSAVPGYAPQQGYQPPQQPPAQPLATGTLDDYYNQPSAGAGPSISWSVNGQQKPIGTTYAGIVARDVTNADVQQQTDPSSGTPKFYRDGRPMFVMKVPLKVQQSQEFPEGEATWFVRGQGRDELTRAMNEVGCSGAPKAGAVIQVTLVQRRPSRMGNPANIVQVVYTPAPGEQQSGQTAAAPSPAAEAQPAQPQAPVQQEAPPTWAQPQAQQAPQLAQPVGGFAQQQVQAYAGPGAQPTPAIGPNTAVVQQPQIQQVPQGVPQGQPVQQQGLPAPASLDPDQQALLARITGQQQG